MSGRRLLLDACCGPCALAAQRLLDAGGREIHYLFYNPNIHPYREYRNRLEAFEALMAETGSEYTVLAYEPEEWMRAVAYREESRCEICYRLRLRRAADFALEEGMEALSTTLFASPHQDHTLLEFLGTSISRSRGLEFVVWDGREVYREVLTEARERGMYTQPYCGCLLSERERYDRSLRERLKGRREGREGGGGMSGGPCPGA
ncbi:epoxyqueuosine reductase QueH [Candidatus Solincola tengchongensis]|uniref:epoxyqueuosine reductase QueH n=1 Tax=Candidatus Solincola tengchongensis TaxID=2900693 RepID=UPI00257E5AE1|nr:epoxyqueuosine reductase QueH [Candidatus Solincola tengchongensis]